MAISCDRLKEKFSKDIQATGIKRTAKEIRLIVSKPKWLKYQVNYLDTYDTWTFMPSLVAVILWSAGVVDLLEMNTGVQHAIIVFLFNTFDNRNTFD